MVDVENNGQSRLCCFRCGYEMCDKCATYLDSFEQQKSHSKLAKLVEKIKSSENGGLVVTKIGRDDQLKLNSGSYRNNKKSTSSTNSTPGAAWVMDGVQLKTISKAVSMQNTIAHGDNGPNGNILNGIAVQSRRD